LYYMRSRYYNPDIKRFINQDVLIGNIGNSNSLNRYSYVEGNPVSYTDPFGLSPYGNFGTFLTVMKFMSQIDIMSLVHVTLSALGALPGCTWLNFINAGLYLAEQNYAEACKSLLFGLANLDWLTGAAKFAVSIGKYTEDLGLILKGIDLGLHLLACCQSATDFGTIAAGMIDKYLVNGEDVTWKIALEFLMLAGTGVQLGLLTHSLTGKLSTTFGGSSLDGGGVSAVTKNKHVQELADGNTANTSNTGDESGLFLPDEYYQKMDDNIAKAMDARDAEVARIKNLSKTKQSEVTTVAAGVDIRTGDVYVGVKNTKMYKGNATCAEDIVSRGLGGNTNANILITPAIRPRNGDVIPVCARCQTKYPKNQFVKGTTFE